MKYWDQLPSLVVLKRITDGSTSNNLKHEIVESFIEIGGLSWDELGNKVVSIFQGVRTGVTMQLKNKDRPFIIGIHCMSHHTLSKLVIMHNIDDLLQSLYGHFSHSPKHHQELVEAIDIVETWREDSKKYEDPVDKYVPTCEKRFGWVLSLCFEDTCT